MYKAVSHNHSTWQALIHEATIALAKWNHVT